MEVICSLKIHYVVYAVGKITSIYFKNELKQVKLLFYHIYIVQSVVVNDATRVVLKIFTNILSLKKKKMLLVCELSGKLKTVLENSLVDGDILVRSLK